MGVYSKKSLELLREKINLVELISSYISLKSVGATYKGLCPFHEEKTPSFVIQKSQSYYHCFGCGAHGDAIAFLMSYMKMSFVEAIEMLAERFSVHLEQVDWETKGKEIQKTSLRQCLEMAAVLFHFYLLYTDEGHEGLKYLYNRGIDLDFIHLFKIGFSPQRGDILQKVMKRNHFKEESLREVGLLKRDRFGRERPFFSGRIMFPIQDAFGHIIGFSARKIREETFGAKYINTGETPLFKKSKTLYGLSFSRRCIAKEKKVLIVEGQIDALRLIQEGFDMTVASQGTAFGQEHVKLLLEIGVMVVYLAFDGDLAGKEASLKVGQLFQKEGCEVFIIDLPNGGDPDTLLRQEGPKAFLKRMDRSKDYLTFLISHLSEKIDLHSPSQKNQLIKTLEEQIQSWNYPLMVHEGLRKVAKMMDVPEELMGLKKEIIEPHVWIKRQLSISEVGVDPNRVLETDLLRWLFLECSSHKRILEIIKQNISPKDFRIDLCRRLFSLYFECLERKEKTDLLQLANHLESAEEQLLFSEIVQKKINTEKAEEGLIETITKLLQRQWMEKREKIRIQIQSGKFSEEKISELVKSFDEIKTKPPSIRLSTKR